MGLYVFMRLQVNKTRARYKLPWLNDERLQLGSLIANKVNLKGHSNLQ